MIPYQLAIKDPFNKRVAVIAESDEPGRIAKLEREMLQALENAAAHPKTKTGTFIVRRFTNKWEYCTKVEHYTVVGVYSPQKCHKTVYHFKSDIVFVLD
jgi:phosphosulfolactate phosphohydrolase-like enzyme